MNFWHEYIDKQDFRRHCDPAVSRDTFCKHLKTFLFAVYWYTYSALEVLRRCAI